MNKLQEKVLALKIQQFQDQSSFAKLYELMVDPLYRFIFLKVNNQELAQDLTSELFLKAWKDLTDRKTPVKQLKAYLYTIARNLVTDYYRSSIKNKEMPLLETMDIEVPSDEKLVIGNMDAQQVMKVLLTLKEAYKEVLLLKHVQELSLSEISQIINKSAVATRVLLHRANSALKREYEKISSTTKSRT